MQKNVASGKMFIWGNSLNQIFGKNLEEGSLRKLILAKIKNMFWKFSSENKFSRKLITLK